MTNSEIRSLLFASNYGYAEKYAYGNAQRAAQQEVGLHARERLGYSPQVSLAEGVARFLEWYGSYYGVKLPPRKARRRPAGPRRLRPEPNSGS